MSSHLDLWQVEDRLGSGDWAPLVSPWVGVETRPVLAPGSCYACRLTTLSVAEGVFSAAPK